MRSLRRLTALPATLGLVASLAACSVVGYPSPTPPGPYGEEGAYGGEGGSAGGRADDGSNARDLPREPASARGNAATYEVFGRTYRTLASAEGLVQEGLASWYGEQFEGRSTSSGEIFDPGLLTAAHRSIPLPSWVEVENLDNGRRVVVRVNDRGPFVDTDRRIIDLSEAAARRLGMIAAGVVPVRIRVLVSPRVADHGGR